MPNPYLNWWSDANEQRLLQNLTTEAIRMHAISIIYMPHTMRRDDVLYTEDILRQYTKTYQVDAYLNNVQGWDGQGDFLSKFGVRVNDKLNLLISRESFDGLIENQNRPNEGDLILLPPPLDAIFEVKFVEHEKAAGQFYPLGGLYFYEVSCELHVYSHEQVNTGDLDIDTIEDTQAFAIDVVLSPGGTGTFSVGETVYQGDSILTASASASVAAWTPDTNTLRVVNIIGAFAPSLLVRGGTSMAEWTVATEPDVLDNRNDPVDDNRYIKDQQDDLIVVERNPITGV